jgi:hypothetical protein
MYEQCVVYSICLINNPKPNNSFYGNYNQLSPYCTFSTAFQDFGAFSSFVAYLTYFEQEIFN